MGKNNLSYADKTVLVVENDTPNLELTKAVLELEGCTVLTAQTIQEAKTIFESEHELDMIFVNLYLADGSGLSLVERFRQKSNNLIIILTTTEDERDFKRGVQITLIQGIDKILFKPFSVNQLRGELRQMLSSLTSESPQGEE